MPVLHRGVGRRCLVSRVHRGDHTVLQAVVVVHGVMARVGVVRASGMVGFKED